MGTHHVGLGGREHKSALARCPDNRRFKPRTEDREKSKVRSFPREEKRRDRWPKQRRRAQRGQRQRGASGRRWRGVTPIPSVCREHHRWPSVMSVSYGEDGITASIQKNHDALMTRSTHRANARTVNDPDAHAAHGTAPRHRGEVQGARRRVDRQSRRIAHRLVVRVHRRRHVRVAEMPLVYNDARTSIHNMKSSLEQISSATTLASSVLLFLGARRCTNVTTQHRIWHH